MATVRKSASAAKSRVANAPKLSLVTAKCPTLPYTNPMHLPHGREMSARFVRTLLINYCTWCDVYHEWLWYEDEHNVCADPVHLKRRAEIDALTPDAREGAWPQFTWRNFLEEAADRMRGLLVRAVVIASGQLSSFDDLNNDDGSGTDWNACAVEVDGQVVAVAPRCMKASQPADPWATGSLTLRS